MATPINFRKSGEMRVGGGKPGKAGNSGTATGKAARLFEDANPATMSQPSAKTKRSLPVASAKPMAYSKKGGMPC